MKNRYAKCIHLELGGQRSELLRSLQQRAPLSLLMLKFKFSRLASVGILVAASVASRADNLTTAVLSREAV